MAYAELQVTTNFSFLRGASHPHEFVERAAALGLSAIAITDRNTLAGVVRAHVAAKALGLKLLVGARLDLQDGPSLLAYPRTRAAYGRLSSLISLGQRRAPKGACHLAVADVLQHKEGLILALVADAPEAELARALQALAPSRDTPLYLAAAVRLSGDDRARIARLAAFANAHGARLLATNDVHYHVAGRRPLQDVVTCIREKTTLTEAGWRLAANAERHLKGEAEMRRLFRGHEDAIEASADIAAAASFSLDELAYEYPEEPIPHGRDPQEHLERLAWRGAAWRYPHGVPDKVKQTIVHELRLIRGLNYAHYFLTVHDIVEFARSRGILAQGRGSAANSVVCYCLGVTAVDPTEVDLLFERFVSAERREPPDIDIDFEHERREEVLQYIYARYGRHKAGLAATVISYRARSSIREVGKVLGLTEDVTAALASTVWGSHGRYVEERRINEAGLDLADPLLARAVALAEEISGFPRHLSQHVGGFVLTRGPLHELVPIGNAAMEDRTVIEWDKDDIDALGILKVDCLGLGMLTCIRKCFELLEAHYERRLDLASIPRDDPAVYDMLCRADSIGVFQVESRAQMSMLPRLKPRCYYDLVIEVAIVRPGPIQGDMVHPYLRRRDGLEPVVYPRPAPEHGPADELEKVLKKTLGVPLFQEQAMRIAIEAAKFTPDEANQLRRAMATFRKKGQIEKLRAKMVGRMIERGYEPELAERCFKQIEGFGEYGFPESHAASFAHLVYASSWLKHYHPDVFCCALLNSQPMGFYAPAQIVRDARAHGVDVREADVNLSLWDNRLEPVSVPGARLAVRLGMRQIDGLAEGEIDKLLAARKTPYTDVQDLWRRAALRLDTIEKLAAADAFRSCGLDRRAALWQARALKGLKPLPLFEAAGAGEIGHEPLAPLPVMTLGEHVVADYQTLRLSLKAHPMSFLRGHYEARGFLTSAALLDAKSEAWIKIAGVVLVRQRPGTAKGVVFMTIEDEMGVANIIVWPKTLETYRRIVMGAYLIEIEGRLQRQGLVLHVVSHRLSDATPLLARLSDMPEEYKNSFARADEVLRPQDDTRSRPRAHPRDVRVLPKSRDFH